MAYTWTDKMGSANSNPALEPHYRAAIIAAATFLEAHLQPEGAEVPNFTRGWYSSPKNDAAREMLAAIDRALPPEGADGAPRGTVRQALLTFAERAAFVVRSGGFGDPGWAALARTLQFPPRRLAAAVAPAPT